MPFPSEEIERERRRTIAERSRMIGRRPKVAREDEDTDLSDLADLLEYIWEHLEEGV